MESRPDPAWVAVGRTIRNLLLDSGLADSDRQAALDFARELLWHPGPLVSPVIVKDAATVSAELREVAAVSARLQEMQDFIGAWLTRRRGAEITPH